MLGLPRSKRAQRAGDVRVSAKLGVARQTAGQLAVAAGDVGQVGK
jgi:hypothetical protein